MKSMYRHAPDIAHKRLKTSTKRRGLVESQSRTQRPAARRVRKGGNRRRKPTNRPSLDRIPVRKLACTALWFAAALALTGGAIKAYHVLDIDRWMVIDRISFVGLNRAERETLLEYSNMHRGDSMFGVNLNEAARALERHPWVKTAAVTRVFPDRIRVAIEERDPTALVSLDGLYFSDNEGEIFKRWSVTDQHDLPLVTGLNRDLATEDPERLRELLTMAIDLYRGLSEWSDVLGTVHEVHHDEALGWSALVETESSTSGPVQLALGRRPHQRIALAARSLVELGNRSMSPAVIWADNERRPQRVHVRLRGAIAPLAAIELDKKEVKP